MEEEWRWVPGYEGRYEVSDQGRVRSFLFSKTGKLMKLDISNTGYPRVHFQFKQTWFVHRLVATVFLPNPLNLPVVNHRDGIKINSAVWNLEWATYSDNMRHSWKFLETYKNRVAKSPRGSANHNAKLTETQVLEIRAIYERGEMGSWRLAKRYGISVAGMKSLLKRRTWAHI